MARARESVQLWLPVCIIIDEEESGKGSEREIAAVELPAKVMEAAKAVLLDKPIEIVTQSESEGLVSYEIEYMDGDVENSITCAENGEFNAASDRRVPIEHEENTGWNSTAICSGSPA